MHLSFCRAFSCTRTAQKLFLLTVAGCCLTVSVCGTCKGECRPAQTFLPGIDKMPGWTIRIEPYTYTSETIYLHINGAADFFLSLGFSCLAGTVYTPADSSHEYISADIYDMTTTLNAFAVFGSRCRAENTPLKIGSDCSAGNNYIVFYKDRYFVEIQHTVTGGSRQRMPIDVAETIAAAIPGPAVPPPELSWLPAEGKVARSDRYRPDGIPVIGIRTGCLTADYSLNGSVSTAFIAFFTTETAASAAFSERARRMGKTERPGNVQTLFGNRAVSGKLPGAGRSIVLLKGVHLAGMYGLKTLSSGYPVMEKITGAIR